MMQTVIQTRAQENRTFVARDAWERGGELVWEGVREGEQARGGRLLRRFVRLAPPVVPGRLAQFARTEALLRSCQEHGLPVPHHAADGSICQHPVPESGSEPAMRWRTLAGQASALLSAAAAAQKGFVISSRDRSALERSISGAPQTGHLADRELIAAKVQEWLGTGIVDFAFVWNQTHPDLRPAGRGLLGHLAVDLMFAVSKGSGILLCKHCGRPYLTNRRASETRNNFCSDCGESGRRRAARDKAAASGKKPS